MSNKIEDLRDHLFATLAALRDPEKPMDVDRARAIAEVGRTVIDSAKAEIEFLKVTGSRQGTGFIELVSTGLPSGQRKVVPVPAALPAPGTVRRCGSCSQVTQADPCTNCGRAL